MILLTRVLKSVYQVLNHFMHINRKAEKYFLQCREADVQIDIAILKNA